MTPERLGAVYGAPLEVEKSGGYYRRARRADERTRPFGTWPSPITAQVAASQGLRLAAPARGRRRHLLARRPPGRRAAATSSCGAPPTAPLQDMTPAGFNVAHARARVRRRRLHRVTAARSSSRTSATSGCIASGPPGSAWRRCRSRPKGAGTSPTAAVDAARGRLICVREDHTVEGRESRQHARRRRARRQRRRRAACWPTGDDFYSTPRLSPDGAQLAWSAGAIPTCRGTAPSCGSRDVAADGVARHARPRRRRRHRVDLPAGLVARTASCSSSAIATAAGACIVRSRRVFRPGARRRCSPRPSRRRRIRPAAVDPRHVDVGVHERRRAWSSPYTRERPLVPGLIDGLGTPRQFRRSARRIEPADSIAADRRASRASSAAPPTALDAVMRRRLDVGRRRERAARVPRRRSMPTQGSFGARGRRVSRPANGQRRTPSTTRRATATVTRAAGERPPLIVISHGGPTRRADSTLDPERPVLDQPRLRRGRRELRRQHRLRPRLPRSPERAVGHRRRRGLRQRRASTWWREGKADPDAARSSAAAAPAATPRWPR